MLVCQALQGIRGGQSGTAVIEAVEPRLRPGVQALLFQVLRNLGRADALRGQLVARKPPPAADALLCTALALAWDPQAAPYEPFTLVNQAVEAAKRGQATRGQASFINACLRRFLRERDALVAAQARGGERLPSHPEWDACRALLAAWTDMLANAGGTEGAEMAPWRAQAADLQAVTTIAARNAEDAMQAYQAAIGQFPASVLAQVCGFGPR